MFGESNLNTCYHCGELCDDIDIQKGDKHFCCTGCEFVYNVLNSNDLDDYYNKFGSTGLSLKNKKDADFEFLDDPIMIEALLQYKIENESKLTVYLPQIYCSSCIWLIENLNRLNPGIIESRVNFLKKEASIRFDNTKISVRLIFELLHRIGYTPLLNLSDSDKKGENTDYKKLWRKVGISGFAFGNLMLFAFPDYLSTEGLEGYFHNFLSYLNAGLAFFVLYAGSDYFISAWNSLKVKHINLDFPISLGIIVLYLRSMYEIITGSGLGYIDSMAGLVFFLLLGKVFQQKTFHNLSFERDYKSYFPISVIRKEGEKENSIPVNNVEVGDILVLRNHEIVPTDSILKSKTTSFDYSFITGESGPVNVSTGSGIYAGAKVMGGSVEVEVSRKFHSGYLIELWNSKLSANIGKSKVTKISDTIAKYFTLVVFLIAGKAFIYWVGNDFDKALNAFTAVLLIACPCAIALSIPFSFGTVMRVYARNNFFIKNDALVENISKLTHIVFDKTGTITDTSGSELNYIGRKLNDIEKIQIKSTVRNSTHPYSRLIYDSLGITGIIELEQFNESAGMGIEAEINGQNIKIGRIDWVKQGFVTVSNELKDLDRESKNKESTVAISINNEMVGIFVVKSKFRSYLAALFNKLKSDYGLSIISGDSDRDMEELQKITEPSTAILFNKMPSEKISYIEKLQSEGETVMMTGDGLNDAGALQQANFGLAVSESIASFTPACDGIILSNSMQKLPLFFRLSKIAMRTVIYSFIISIIYNIVGFSFAVQGTLSPIIAAILMPISSVSVVLFAVGKLSINSKRLKL